LKRTHLDGANRRKGQEWCVALSAALLSACAVGPDYKRPAVPAAKAYSPQPLAVTTASAPVAGGDAQHFVMGRDIPFAWWTMFQSPKLDALVEKALKNNPSIPAAEAALRQGQELVRAQYGYFYPTVAANYSYERQKLPGNLASSSAPGLQGNGQNLQPGAPTQPLIYNFSTAELDVGFTPDVFGANRRKVESLQAQANALRYQMEATYITLADNVVAAAIQEAALRAQIDATRQFIDQNAKAVEILHNQFKLGYAMGIDVATQESAQAQAQAQLPPLQKQLEQTRDLICALVGSLPDEDLDLSFDFASLHLPENLPLSLPAKIIEQRPDVRAAEEQLRSANAQVGVAVAAMLPQVAITGSIGGGANEFNDMFSPGGPFWTLIGGVSQPVFEGGTLLHTRRAADQGLIQAAALYRGTVITAFQNVADTLHAIQSDGDALAADAKAEQAAKKALDITGQQYKLGYVNLLALLSAQETYQQAVVSLVQAQGTRYGDTAALFQALGGGWWNREQAVAKAD
jgi:NodT family efflux transporter outer membrane factor (OMF) lipoprotein